jgi:hypothetical protein
MNSHSTASDTMDYDTLTENITAQVMCHLGVPPKKSWLPWVDAERKAYENERSDLTDTIVDAMRLHDKLIKKVFEENHLRPLSPAGSESIENSLAALNDLVDGKFPDTGKRNPYYNMEMVRANIKYILKIDHSLIAPYLTGGKYGDRVVHDAHKRDFSDSRKLSIDLVRAVIYRGGRQGWVNEKGEWDLQRQASRERNAQRGRDGR